MNILKSKSVKITSWVLIVIIFGCFVRFCNNTETVKWNKQVARHKIDSIEVVRSNSVHPFEPRYKLYLSNGQTVTVSNRQYAYNTDSVEFIYYRKIN